MPLNTATDFSDAAGLAEDPPDLRIAEIAGKADLLLFRRTLRADGRVESRHFGGMAERLFGTEAARGGADDLRELFDAEHRDEWDRVAARSAATLEPLIFEGRLAGPGGAERWVRAAASPRREPSGDIVWDGLATDVTAERSARLERARLATIIEASGDAIYSWTIDGTISSWNAEAERLFGYAADETIGRPLRTLIPPDRDISADWAVQQLKEGRTFRQFETTRLHKDGTRIDVSLTVSPLRDEAGRIVAVSTIARDIRARKATEKALRLAEERFRTTLSSIGDGVIATDRDGRLSFLNPVAEQLTGWAAEEALGRSLSEVFRIVSEATGEPVGDPVGRVLAEGGIVGIGDHVLLLTQTGAAVPIADSAAPILDAAGDIVGAVLVFRDVTAERAHEAQRELLVRELDHRVKNTLTLVQSIVRQTVRGSARVDELKEALDGRLQALASAHHLLVKSGWREATLEALVRDVLAPHVGDGAGGCLEVSGPPVRLSAGAAPTIGMVLHELGTNAAKYGALSAPGGRVEVRWRLEPDSGRARLELRWQEFGGPPVRPPAHKGFGSRMIERAAVHQLQGEAEISYEPGGVVCRLAVPVAPAEPNDTVEAAL